MITSYHCWLKLFVSVYGHYHYSQNSDHDINLLIRQVVIIASQSNLFCVSWLSLIIEVICYALRSLSLSRDMRSGMFCQLKKQLSNQHILDRRQKQLSIIVPSLSNGFKSPLTILCCVFWIYPDLKISRTQTPAETNCLCTIYIY